MRPCVRSARARSTHSRSAVSVRSRSRAAAPTVLPSSRTRRTALALNSSVNWRRGASLRCVGHRSGHRIPLWKDVHRIRIKPNHVVNEVRFQPLIGGERIGVNVEPSVMCLSIEGPRRLWRLRPAMTARRILLPSLPWRSSRPITATLPIEFCASKPLHLACACCALCRRCRFRPLRRRRQSCRRLGLHRSRMRWSMNHAVFCVTPMARSFRTTDAVLAVGDQPQRGQPLGQRAAASPRKWCRPSARTSPRVVAVALPHLALSQIRHPRCPAVRAQHFAVGQRTATIAAMASPRHRRSI